MALPITEKTWQFDVNNQILRQSTPKLSNASILLEIKNILKGFASNPWTVVGSSDSSTAGLDTTDRWVTASNLVWANNGSANSWIVLKQTGLDTNFQLLIACQGTSTNGDSLYVSFSSSAGFTGGSTTNKPTATDEQVIKNNSTWGGSSSGSAFITTRLNVQQSYDGQCTRIWFFTTHSTFAVNLVAVWIFDRVKLPTTGWTNPYFAGIIATNSTSTDVGVITNFGTTNFLSRHSGTAMNIAMTWEGGAWDTSTYYPLTTIIPSYNEVTGEFELYPIGLISSTSGVRGRHGQVYDLWWISIDIPDGAFFPDDASKEFVKVGCLVFPWPGSVNMLRG